MSTICIIYFAESSITDWIQVAVSIALFYTIYLQFKANKLQTKQLQISLLPKFEIKVETAEPFFDPHLLNAGTITITVTRNQAYNVRLYVEDEHTIKLEHLNMNGMYFSDGDTTIKNFTYHREKGIEGYIPPFILKITFADIIGNNYAQNIMHFEGRIIPNAPNELR